MYLAGNYCYQISAIAPPRVGSLSQLFVVVHFRLVVIFLLRGITDMLRYVDLWFEGQP